MGSIGRSRFADCGLGDRGPGHGGDVPVVDLPDQCGDTVVSPYTLAPFPHAAASTVDVPRPRLPACRSGWDVHREGVAPDTDMKPRRPVALPSRRTARGAAGAGVVVVAVGLTGLVVPRAAPQPALPPAVRGWGPAGAPLRVGDKLPG